MFSGTDTQNVTLYLNENQKVLTASGGVYAPASGAATVEFGEGKAFCGYTFKAINAYTGAYSVAYDANGGTGAPSDANVYCAGSTVAVVNDVPTRDGYAFHGWNTKADGAGESYSPGSTFVMPSGDVTLYAQWHTHACASGAWQSDASGHWQVCDVCGARFNEAAHANTSGTWASDGTSHWHACDTCGYRLDEAAHSATEVWVAGESTHWKECDACKAKLDEAAHAGGTATCVAAAACETCGSSYGKKDPSNHAGGTEVRDAKAATCTEAGYTGDTYCLGCETKLASGTAIAALGHDYGTLIAEQPATAEAAGMKTHYVCSRCGAYFDADKTETTAEALVIPKLASDDSNSGEAGTTAKGTNALAATGDATAPLAAGAFAFVGAALATAGLAACRRREM